MDKDRFDKIIEPIVERRAKGIRRSWQQLTLNEQQDASVIVEPKCERTCEDCGLKVVNRRITIFYLKHQTGRKVRRELLNKWVKRCENCQYEEVISHPFKDSAK